MTSEVRFREDQEKGCLNRHDGFRYNDDEMMLIMMTTIMMTMVMTMMMTMMTTMKKILGRSEEGCLNMHDRFPFQVVELSDTIVKCPQLHWNGNLTLKYSRREVKVPG